MWLVFASLIVLSTCGAAARKIGRKYDVEYYDANSKLNRSMLDKAQCGRYTKACIMYRHCYPECLLPKDRSGNVYNPCRKFVEPCFGIPLEEYNKVKKFRDDTEF
ncbi:hypothetical protein Tcan_14738 [Toxocara canis]|uniref:Uncharacterized protein n=1 Tax=Toxocara canis TaxID=6265 RepID=A0A0B2UT00_TOXCA|nr:hypothetical protein Tcan_14738 [Toxocara canis]